MRGVTRGVTIASLVVFFITSGILSAHASAGRDDTTVPEFQHPDYDTLGVGVVTRILDENTVLVRINRKYERYDLLGVTAFTVPKSAYAQVATDFLKRSLLHEQVRVQFDTNAKRNHDGRFAVFLYRSPDHLFVNLELVRQGLVRADRTQLDLHRKDFDYHSKRAEERQVGLWDSSPHPTSNPDANPKELQEPAPPNELIRPQTVYITEHGKKYHREGCSHLTDSARSTSREQILATHAPCKTCRPDEGR